MLFRKINFQMVINVGTYSNVVVLGLNERPRPGWRRVWLPPHQGCSLTTFGCLLQAIKPCYGQQHRPRGPVGVAQHGCCDGLNESVGGTVRGSKLGGVECGTEVDSYMFCI